MKIIVKFRAGMVLFFLFLCGCATQTASPSRLPPEVKMNRDAGRGNWLILTLKLATGEDLPLIVDTGDPITILDQSIAPKLGNRLDTGTLWFFGVAHAAARYAAPKLYLGGHRLLTSTNVAVFDCGGISADAGRPILGILGMDILGHYCIQLDFKHGRVSFPDDEQANKAGWGKSFPMADEGDGCLYIDNNLTGGKGPGSLIDTGFFGDGCLTSDLFRSWTSQTKPGYPESAHSPNGMLGGEIYHELDLPALAESDVDGHSGFNTIGLRVLSQNLVTLDFPKRTLYLKRASKQPLAHENAAAMAKVSGASALGFLERLKKAGKMPGWTKSDHGRTTFFRLNYVPYFESVTLDLKKDLGSSIYHYTLIRASKKSPWQLKSAWRTDAGGQRIEEYPVP